MVGISSDEFASRGRTRVNPLGIRLKALEAFLDTLGKSYSIHVIDDHLGPAAEIAELDVLVVSEETLPWGELVNDTRAWNGLPPLEIVTVPMVLAADGSPISATRISAGDLDRKGSSSSITIGVGSRNPAKVEAVRSVMEAVYGDVRLVAMDVSSGVPDQPWGHDTIRGARNRAAAALMDHDLAVGIEAGVFEGGDGLYDRQHCVIVDREGRITHGFGPAFRYPDHLAELVRKGASVGGAMASLPGGRDRGSEDGAIGMLSRGLLDRRRLTEQAVMAAMIPRIRDDYSEL